MAHPRRWFTLGAPLTLLLAAATALSIPASAPRARAQGAGDAPHPVHIHSGTCDNLGDIVSPLTDIALNTAGESFGLPSAIPVEESETDVPLALSAILAAPHAINVHESKEAIQNYIACGDIGGRVVDGDLLIGLHEVNGSGYAGVAKLDSDDDETDVNVYLTRPGGAEAAAAPATTAPAVAATTAAAAPTEAPAAATEAPAAPTEAAPAAQDVPVDIRNFAFSPAQVEIAAGDTVTWTNQDPVPHTATGEQRDALQSGAIAPGSSFSQVFPTPGEFKYFCEFHPNMLGAVVVK